MQRPGFHTMVAGHPIIAVPGVLLSGAFGYLAVHAGAGGWPPLIALLFGCYFLTCARDAGRYRSFKREWDALDPNHVPWSLWRTLGNIVKCFVGGGLVIGVALVIAAYRDPHSPVHWLVPLSAALVASAFVLRWLLRLRARRSSSSQTPMVTQAISRPLPPPSAAEAYARLPDYCGPLFSQAPKE